MEHKSEFYGVLGEDGEVDYFARSLPHRTLFGDKVITQVMGIVKMLRTASEADLNSLSLAMALDTLEMRAVVKAIVDFCVENVAWDKNWASLQPI